VNNSLFSKSFNYKKVSGELTKVDIRKLKRKSYQFISEVFTEELNNKFIELGFKDVIVKPREVENHDQDPLTIEIYYNKLTETDRNLKPEVLVEVGSRSLKEPYTQRTFGPLFLKFIKTILLQTFQLLFLL
jgi:hypothetical protein